MREILFRGKDKYSGKWVEGDLNQLKFYGEILCCNIIPYEDDLHSHEVIPETVGQYTGLTDKNNVKIFEGDILKGCYDEDNPEEYSVFAVFWNNGWRIHHNATESDILEEFDCRICEVAGNIHDNPELLEGGESNDR